VLVLRPGRDLEGEMTVLDGVRRLFPDAAVVVTGESDQAALAGPAWGPGAPHAPFPPPPRGLLPGILRGVMAAGATAARGTRLPALDETRCTGCGDCVSVCPVACLAMAGPVVWLPRPADCVACALCARVCPADAIALPPARP